MKLYRVTIHYPYGCADYYAVMAENEGQAEEKLETALLKENITLKHASGVYVDEADMGNNDIAYITETSG